MRALYLSGVGRFGTALVAMSLALGCSSDDGESNSSGGSGGGAGATGGSGGDAGSSSGSASGGSGGSDAPAGPCVPDESAPVASHPNPGTWQRVEIDGVCGNGSPYAIFVNYSDRSNNLVVAFEGGGGCWDYPSCSGNGGIRGAANVNGIAPDLSHMDVMQFLPLHRDDPVNPAEGWNVVFIPYCTGDVHTGNNVITYENPDPNGEDLEFHHNGHDNVMKAIEWMDQTFENVPRMLATGCSAGGAGSIVNYHFLRQGLSGVQCGYLLDDSGPIFPSSGNSKPVHDKIRESWNVDPILDEAAVQFADVGIDADAIKADFGKINTALADLYPQDRLAITFFRLDFNYSLYSYDTFYDFPPNDRIHELWWEDTQALMAQYDTRDNLAYFIPYFRIDNCSHCVSIPPIAHIDKALTEPWFGSEIQDDGTDLRGFTVDLLDDTKDLVSYLEEPGNDGEFTEDEANACR